MNLQLIRICQRIPATVATRQFKWYRLLPMDGMTDCLTSLDRVVSTLASRLADNLHSCILYGSAARGDFVEGVSDVNLLIVLTKATPEAHTAIAEAIRGSARINPFALGRDGFERSQRVFALKFRSIQRNYKVLRGEDVLAHFAPDEPLIRFLCEQSLRNLRLRLKHAYIMFGDDRGRYSRYVVRSLPALRVALSETARCEGIELPKSITERLPVFERLFAMDASILRELLAMRDHRRTLTVQDIADCHARLFRLLSQAVHWIENRWPTTSPTKS